ncbi:hypothetical protein, partial [Thermogutta sp.]|uniref:hypothetical protein n=1 Tax=Thermogutta sp. TaxID=1962930 RepID=UPI003C79A802
LRSKNREHRAVRRLLVEVGQKLMARAFREAEAGQWELVIKTLDIAGQCTALEGEALALQKHAVQALAEKKREQERELEEQAKIHEQVSEARRLAQAGEFTLALELLARWETQGRRELAAAIEEIRLGQRRFEMAVQACEEALERGDEGLARHHWETLREIARQAPQVKQLAGKLASLAARGSHPAVDRARPVQSRSEKMLMEGVGMILLGEEIVVGSSREEVHLPILGRIHRRHAVLLRDRQGWQLVVCRDKYGEPCPVEVDGHNVTDVYRLEDGNVVQLGEDRCRWRFRLPISGSLTALWEALPDSTGSVLVPSTGETVRRAVFFVDELSIRPHAPAHIIRGNLPCQGLILRWEKEGLHWDVQGGSAWAEIPGVTWIASDRCVYLPSRLVIEAQWDEAERLGHMFAERQQLDRVTLIFRQC